MMTVIYCGFLIFANMIHNGQYIHTKYKCYKYNTYNTYNKHTTYNTHNKHITYNTHNTDTNTDLNTDNTYNTDKIDCINIELKTMYWF